MQTDIRTAPANERDTDSSIISGPLGARYLDDGRCSFLVWAPKCAGVDVRLLNPERLIPLNALGNGYHGGIIDGVEPGADYFFRLNGTTDRPDPASRFQPDGVHGPSRVTDPHFDWQDRSWTGTPLEDYIFYELHVGTFTEEGTFEAIIPHLRRFHELGITAIELMPIAQFPGTRNWGYDGVSLFAPQNSYGGPQGLRRLVNACHEQGISVVLDVVYNHFGPEGNYLSEFGHYFTERYHTPWGNGVNFDGAWSDEVRRFFIENALYWFSDFHIDALRLDAVHAIRDFSAIPFLRQLARATAKAAEQSGRSHYLIAESDLNDPRLLLPEELGGYGLDAQWSDDFHHCLHVLLTGERQGYYEDFVSIDLFAKAFREGFAYTGEYSPFRKRTYGAPTGCIPPKRFVVFSQNHDQIGNRAFGERLSRLISFEGLKLAAGAVILSPYLPLLFMGEEHGEQAPFLYMTSHTDPALVEAVRKGRREEFAAFGWQEDVPDPQLDSTFRRSVIRQHRFRKETPGGILFNFYHELLRIRKRELVLVKTDKQRITASARSESRVILVQYQESHATLTLLLCFAKTPQSVVFDLGRGEWSKVIDSSDDCWNGPGTSIPEWVHSTDGLAQLTLSGESFCLLRRPEP